LEGLGFGSLDGDTGTLDLQGIFLNPSVSSLTLAGYREEGVSWISGPWYQITSLKLIGCSLNALPAILSQLPNLTDLEFGGELVRSGAHYSGHSMELPRLLSLRISGYLHHISKFLPILRTPALRNLSMIIFKAFFIRPEEHSLDAQVVNHFISQAKQVEHPALRYIDQPDVATLWERVIQYIH
jgi:hypothetical protein